MKKKLRSVQNNTKPRQLRSLPNVSSLHVGWENLPYPVLVEIYRYLSDRDRVAMSQVCHEWRKSFKDPSLWRSKQFTIGGANEKITNKRTLAFTALFGKCLHSVSIVFHHRTSKTCQAIYPMIQILLRNIQNASLNKLDLIDLELTKFRKYPVLVDMIISCLVDLFKKTSLSHVKLKSCEFNVGPGNSVLKALSQTSGIQLRSLDLTHYFCTSLAVYENKTFLNNIFAFINLEEISLNYSCMSEEVIQHWAVQLKQKLKHLDIKVAGTEPHYHVIRTQTWNLLLSACPKLAVKISFDNLSNSDVINPLLSSVIPLVSLSVMSNMEFAMDMHFGATLNHIAENYENSLQELYLKFELLQDSLDHELVYILERCRKLKILRVMANAGITVANAVINLLRNHQSQLREVDLFLDDNTEDPELMNASRSIEEILNIIR